MGKQSKQQTSTTAPWQPQQQYLLAGFDAAQNELLNQPWQRQQMGPQMPGLNGYQTQAINQTARIGRGGSPAIDAAQQQAASTIRGDYLNANPYLQGAIDNAVRPMTENYMRAVQPGIASNFAQAGRFGGGAHENAMGGAQDALARGIGQVAGNMSYQNYGQERQNQLGMANNAGQIYGQQFIAPQMMAQMGGMQDQRNVARWDANRQQQWNTTDYNNQLSANRLGAYQGIVGGNYGGQQSSPLNRNAGAGALGGAMSGAQIGSAIMPGWGTAIGAIGGGLLGLAG